MTALLRGLGDLLNPPPLAPHLATPSAFATAYSRGQWRPARHLELVEQACLDTIHRHGRLILSVSVRHGKSEYASRWLPAWYLATHPHDRVILAGHEADFAASHGRAARNILTEYGSLYGVAVSKQSNAADRWDLAKPNTGGMLTVGVGGSPIGRGADLCIVDDPIKSYADAMSPLVRSRVQEWWTGTMVSRLEPGAAVILIMARWHEDDLAGFLLSEQPDEWAELRLPAIAETDDPMGRTPGEALWPERFTADELERRRLETGLKLGEAVWLAQYQQRPTLPKGGMFPEDRWLFFDAVEFSKQAAWDVKQWCRGWDLAATEDGGDWTCGVLIGRQADGRFVVGDVTRGRWSSDQVRTEIRRCAEQDPSGTRIELPQDPGQAGKDQAQQLVRMLAGRDVHSRPQSGAKDVRATGWAAQQQARNVLLVEAGWNGPFVAEHGAFPRGTHDDQVDASASAFNALTVVQEVVAVPYRNLALRGTR